MKKKLLTVSILIILLAILGTGTLAAFTTRDTAHNVITTSGVDIRLEETLKDGTPYPTDPIQGVMPGQTLEKCVSVRNLDATAWIRVKVTKTVIASDKVTKLDTDPVELNIGKLPTAADWIEKDGYYYYTKPVAKDESTSQLFTEVTLNGPDMDNVYQSCTINIDVSADAVQTANNGATVLEAQGWPEA